MEKGGARRDLTRAYVLLARARQAAGDAEGALEALGQALDMGIETRAFHYLVVKGQHVFELFRRLLRQNLSDRRVIQIIAHPCLARRRPAGHRRPGPGLAGSPHAALF